MAKASDSIPNTRHYKLASLEQALVSLRQIVSRPQDMRQLHLTPTQAMMLLEAARLGAAELYKSLSPLEDISRYNMP